MLLATGFVGPELTVGEMLGLKTCRAPPRLANLQRRARQVRHQRRRRLRRRRLPPRPSLVVWAINEGRGAARAVDEYLMGFTNLPAPGINAPQQVV